MEIGKSRSKSTKSKGYSLTFLLFFAPLWKKEKVAENGRKVKAMALLFCCFLPLYEKVAENGRKVKAIALLFAVFCPFMKNGKSR
jgi:hypothetical protein